MPAVHAQAPGLERGWTQARGNAASTGRSDFEAIRAQPEEAWRVELGPLAAEPVAWQGIVYAAIRKGRETRLVALRLEDGESLGMTRLGKSERVGLAVWEGQLLVTDESGLRTFTHKRDRFKVKKRLRTPLSAHVTVYDGLALSTVEGTSVVAVDLESLKEVARVPGGRGKPALQRDTVMGELLLATWDIGRSKRLKGSYLTLVGGRVGGIEEEALSLPASRDYLTLVQSFGEESGRGYVMGMGDGVWYVRSPLPLTSSNSSDGLSAAITGFRGDDALLAPIVSTAAVFDGAALGFDAGGDLIGFSVKGYAPIVTAKDMPPGARSAPPTIASDVMYLGNWAVNLEDRRVLWCMPDVEPTGALIPVGGGRAVYESGAGELVCLADSRADAPDGGDPGAAAHEPWAAVRPDVAGDAAVLVLAEGQVHAGEVDLSSADVVRVERDGEALEFPRSAVSFADDGAGTRHVGEPLGLHRAWTRSLEAAFLARLVELIDEYAAVRQISDARRLLAEAKRYGLEAERAKKIDDSLAGKVDKRAGNSKAQRERKLQLEERARQRAQSSFLEAARWCRERGQSLAASALLESALAVAPDADAEECLALARKLVPEAFPYRERPDAAQLWLRWSRELLAADGAFLRSGDPVWEAADERWRSLGVALVTRNLLLFSDEEDPALIGACLRNGEGAVRILEELLGQEREERLIVRLFKQRDDYLADEGLKGGRPMPWSAGVYSPADRVSTFFVPRDEAGEPQSRMLQETLTHELTHHYVDRRWIENVGFGSVSQDGYWIVEGIAGFVEEQALELGRVDRGMEDPTVLSVDVCTRLLEQDRLLDLEHFFGGDYRDFSKLGDEPVATVRPRYTLGEIDLSARSIFYKEAAALVFFQMNRCGDEGRRGLLEYLEAYYRGRMTRSGWKELGWKDVATLDKAFREFLRDPAADSAR